ncbi:MAG: hypothetical protein OXU25_07240 [Thaumarchaeota archaeon]|nr:hypothetical protein [Nitrososphaerota archaeon]
MGVGGRIVRVLFAMLACAFCLGVRGAVRRAGAASGAQRRAGSRGRPPRDGRRGVRRLAWRLVSPAMRLVGTLEVAVALALFLVACLLGAALLFCMIVSWYARLQQER